MLASTMQFSTNNPNTPPPTTRKTPEPADRACAGKPETTNPTPPHQPHPSHHHPHTRQRHPQQGTPPTERTTAQPAQPTQRHEALLSQDPTVCQTITTTTHQPTLSNPTTTPEHHPHQQEGTAPGTETRRTRAGQHQQRNLFIDIPPMSTHRGTNARAMG